MLLLPDFKLSQKYIPSTFQLVLLPSLKPEILQRLFLEPAICGEDVTKLVKHLEAKHGLTTFICLGEDIFGGEGGSILHVASR